MRTKKRAMFSALLALCSATLGLSACSTGNAKTEAASAPEVQQLPLAEAEQLDRTRVLDNSSALIEMNRGGAALRAEQIDLVLYNEHAEAIAVSVKAATLKAKPKQKAEAKAVEPKRLGLAKKKAAAKHRKAAPKKQVACACGTPDIKAKAASCEDLRKQLTEMLKATKNVSEGGSKQTNSAR